MRFIIYTRFLLNLPSHLNRLPGFVMRSQATGQESKAYAVAFIAFGSVGSLISILRKEIEP